MIPGNIHAGQLTLVRVRVSVYVAVEEVNFEPINYGNVIVELRSPGVPCFNSAYTHNSVLSRRDSL